MIQNMGEDDEHEFKYKDEAPLSPVGQVFRKFYSRKSENVINCAMVVRDPIDVISLKEAISNSIMLKHPRFCSLVVRDQSSGCNTELLKRTQVNIDDHVFVHHQTSTKTGVNKEDEDKEAAINSFLADISVSTPLSETKPLWEVHVLLGLNCVVFRVHHALGDGNSLMSMLCACFGKSRPASDATSEAGSSQIKKGDGAKKKWRKQGVWAQVKSLWYTNVMMLKVIGRIFWVKDEVSMLSGGDGVELWPRKLVTAKFNIDELKSIKLVIPKATINDVLLGIISSGLSNYLNIKSSAVQRALQLSFIIPVNLRKDSSMQEISELMKTPNSELTGWGNKSSVVIVPIDCCNGLKPLEHVKQKKLVMDKMKKSCYAQFGFKMMNVIISCLGPKVGCWIFYKLISHTTLSMSNVVGPSEDLVIGDNPITDIKLNTSSTSHAISFLLVSYAGKINLQVMVAKDIIPDPEQMVKCFQDSFQEMKSSNKMKLQV